MTPQAFVRLLAALMLLAVLRSAYPATESAGRDAADGAAQALRALEAEYYSFHVFRAGSPHYNSNFSRDAFIALILTQDPARLEQQIRLSSFLQGRVQDPATGEESGKIHHEWPGNHNIIDYYAGRARVNGFSSEYNASDTTALFLIALRRHADTTGSFKLCDELRGHIEAAAGYVKRHVGPDGLFYESPEYAGAKRFALNVTYWKDSGLYGRTDGKPVYPVVYPLVQAMYIRAMRDAAYLTGNAGYARLAETMRIAFAGLFSFCPKEKGLPTAIDAKGPVCLVSSDPLHALWYIEPGDLSGEHVRRIAETAAALETPYGFRVLEPGAVGGSRYHRDTVWPFENALIHAAAEKFGLGRVAEVSGRMASFLAKGGFPECLALPAEPDGPATRCNPNLQLWTIGAEAYFRRAGLLK